MASLIPVEISEAVFEEISRKSLEDFLKNLSEKYQGKFLGKRWVELQEKLYESFKRVPGEIHQ